MHVTSVIVRIGIRAGKNAGERIHPGAGAQVVLVTIRTRALGIGASCAQMRPASTRRGTAKAAIVLLQRRERMLQPGLPDLFKATVVSRAAAHSIQILGNDRVVGAR